jgi:hypothetical protein
MWQKGRVGEGRFGLHVAAVVCGTWVLQTPSAIGGAADQ